MTIDEAIKFCYEKSKNIKLKAEPQVFIQIAEWLEELKAYKDSERLCKRGFEGGYTKAIDDFVEKLEEHQQENWVDNLEYGITWNDIEQVAEQLKAGGSIG